MHSYGQQTGGAEATLGAARGGQSPTLQETQNRAMVLQVRSANKTYPGVKAVSSIDLELRTGEIRFLVGENGSGKSTLVEMLAGNVTPDPGSQIRIDGSLLKPGDAGHSRSLGVAMIHQELTVVGQATALENVFLGDVPHRFGFLDSTRMKREYDELSHRLGCEMPPTQAANTLSIADQTMLEIMRAVRRNAKVLILDEPTATLGGEERQRVYALIRKLATSGVGCLWISHDYEEIFELGHSITVMRNGTHVRTAVVPEWTMGSLVRAMLDGDADASAHAEITVEEALQARRAEVSAGQAEGGREDPGPQEGTGGLRSAPVLAVSDVHSDRGTVIERLEVHPGEILGIAGLVGSGRTSLLQALAGVRPVRSGRMCIDGREVRWPKSPARAVSAGIALLPEDRKSTGLVLGSPAVSNVVLTSLRSVSRLGFISRSLEWSKASTLLHSLNFRGSMVNEVRQLSGGNQQKVLIAKWLLVRPRVLLIDEPTRGIDIGAKEEILTAIRRLADAGHAIVWVSSELQEIESVSDRVLVLQNGYIADELIGDAISRDTIIDRVNSTGHRSHPRSLIQEPSAS